MKKFVTIKPFKTFRKVKHYTFWVDGRERSEADAFFSRFEHNEELAKDLDTLVAWLAEVGDNRGATGRHFRPENAANALPPPAKVMVELTVGSCNLRLYCVRLSEEVVILANGGRKTSDPVQKSPDALPHFQFANKMAKQLLQLQQERAIDIQGKNINNLEDIDLWD